MTVLNTKHSSRAIPLFSAVAALMSLLTAAAGPFAQTVKVVRVETPDHTRPGEFELIVSAIDAVPPGNDAPTSKSQSQSAPDQSAKIVQPLSGHWESAAQIHIPLADVPAPAAFVIPIRTTIASFQAQVSDTPHFRQVRVKSGRAPPLA